MTEEQTTETVVQVMTASDNPPQSADEVDSSLAAAIEKADADVVETQASIGRERDGNGRFVPKADSSPKVEQDPADAVDADPGDEIDDDVADDEVEEDVVSDVDLQKAMEAMKREGYPESKYKDLSKDPDLLEWALKKAKVHADLDDKFRLHQSTASELAQIKKAIGDSAAPPASADQPTDVQGALEPMTSHFKEWYAMEDDVVDSMVEPFRVLERTFASRMDEQERRMTGMLNTQARTMLTADFPQLEKDDVFERVAERASQLRQLKTYDDHVSLIRDAAQVELAPELVAEAERLRKQRRKRRDNGVPAASQQRAADAATSVNLGDLQMQSLQALQEGNVDGYEKLNRQIQAHQQT